MKKLFLTALAAMASLVLPSCLQSETTIRLNKDGSGTIIEETTFGAQMMGMLAQMAALGGEGNNDPLADLVSEEKAKERAAELGEGVTFEKAEAIEKNGGKGGRITYRFANINKLKIAPGDSMKNAMPEAPGNEAVEAESQPVAFKYADGELTILMPEPKKPEAAPEGANELDADNPQMEEMMKQMFADMKVSFKLVIEPGIAESNATHKDGDTITLMEMDMGKVVQNKEGLKKLTSLNQEDPSVAMEQMQGIEGVKVEAQREVKVKLK